VPIPIPSNHVGFGVAIAGAVVYDPLDRTGSGTHIRVINLAKIGERNPDLLCEQALKEIRGHE
jgi:hypothetical protein